MFEHAWSVTKARRAQPEGGKALYVIMELLYTATLEVIHERQLCICRTSLPTLATQCFDHALGPKWKWQMSSHLFGIRTSSPLVFPPGHNPLLSMCPFICLIWHHCFEVHVWTYVCFRCNKHYHANVVFHLKESLNKHSPLKVQEGANWTDGGSNRFY